MVVVVGALGLRTVAWLIVCERRTLRASFIAGTCGGPASRVLAVSPEVPPMATTTPSTATSLVPAQPVFTDAERLALAGFLAGYRGLTREAYTLDLRQFTGWCRTRSPPPCSPTPSASTRPRQSTGHTTPDRTGTGTQPNWPETAITNEGNSIPPLATAKVFSTRATMLSTSFMSGLPPHIAQVICGHKTIDTTIGYKAVYPAEAIEAHRAFIARRRATRPSEEYRTPTDEEWDEFLAHFVLCTCQVVRSSGLNQLVGDSQSSVSR